MEPSGFQMKPTCSQGGPHATNMEPEVPQKNTPKLSKCFQNLMSEKDRPSGHQILCFLNQMIFKSIQKLAPTKWQQLMQKYSKHDSRIVFAKMHDFCLESLH